MSRAKNAIVQVRTHHESRAPKLPRPPETQSQPRISPECPTRYPSRVWLRIQTRIRHRTPLRKASHVASPQTNPHVWLKLATGRFKRRREIVRLKRGNRKRQSQRRKGKARRPLQVRQQRCLSCILPGNYRVITRIYRVSSIRGGGKGNG